MAPPEDSTNGASRFWQWVWNAVVVIFGVIALLLLTLMALDYLVTDAPPPPGGPGGKLGASDAIALISAAGGIILGIVGAYFGVNIASKSADTAQATQVQANEANRTAVAAAAALDPTSDATKRFVETIER